MNAKQIQALLSCIRINAIDTAELYAYLNEIRPGDFHFTNGTHFPALLPGLTADGVFADNEYYLTNQERVKGKTTLGRAENFCKYRGTVLPSSSARDAMEQNRSVINVSLAAIGFPKLQDGEYWAAEDQAGYGEPPTISFDGPGVGDWNLYGGTGGSYSKYVRGCKKVSKNSQLVNFTEKEEKNNPGMVFDLVLKNFGVSRYDFRRYGDSKNRYPQPGNYLLKNGKCSRSTVYNQEAGIFVNANLYIKLDMPENLFTAEQAGVYIKAYENRLPEYFELRQIAKAAERINPALKSVGMENFILPENVIEGCWYQEALAEAGQNERFSDEKRRILLVGNQKNVSDSFIILDDILDRIAPE